MSSVETLKGSDLPFLEVYIADFPSDCAVGGVFNRERAEEISRCKSKAIARQKYCVWRLLERALARSLGKDIGSLKLYKSDSGKWCSCEACFSMSHSANVAAVAVSSANVGVDVQLLEPSRFNERLADRILTADEREAYFAIKGDKSAFLAELWAKKESIFKLRGERGGVISTINALGNVAFARLVNIGGRDYVVSVAGDAASSDFSIVRVPAEEYLPN